MAFLQQRIIIALLINLFKCDSSGLKIISLLFYHFIQINNGYMPDNQCNIDENNIIIYHTTVHIAIDTQQIIHPVTMNYDIGQCPITECDAYIDKDQDNYFAETSIKSTDTNANTPLNDTTNTEEQKEINTPITNSFNFASFDSGANVLDKSEGIKSSKSILLNRKDKYMMMPCELEDKWFVIQLSEDIVIDRIQIINLEHYSSNIKDIRIYARTSNDNHDDNDTNSHDWFYLSDFQLENRNKNSISFADSHWVRLLKIEILSYYGNEYYCTLTQIKVFGSTMLGHWKNAVMSDLEKADQIKHNITKQANPTSNVNITVSKDIVLPINEPIPSYSKQQSVFTILTERITSLELNLTKQQMQVAHLLNVFNRIDELDEKFNGYQLNLSTHMLFQSHGLMRLIDSLQDGNGKKHNNNGDKNENKNGSQNNKSNGFNDNDWSSQKSYYNDVLSWKRYEQLERIESYMENVLFMISNLYWIGLIIIITQIIMGICFIVYVCGCCQRNSKNKKHRKANSTTHRITPDSIPSNKSSTRHKFGFSRTLSQISMRKKNTRKKFKR